MKHKEVYDYQDGSSTRRESEGNTRRRLFSVIGSSYIDKLEAHVVDFTENAYNAKDEWFEADGSDGHSKLAEITYYSKSIKYEYALMHCRYVYTRTLYSMHF